MCAGLASHGLDEFQDRDDQWDELFALEVQQLVQRLRIFHIKLTGTRAPQFREMRAATELLADIVTQRANVCAFRARDAEVDAREIEFQHSEIVDVNEARL